MALTKLQFRAGINRDSTSYTNEGGWFDGDKVRFRNGLPEKIGGWTKYSDTQFVGTCRALHTWTALDNTNFIGIGTSQKYYLNSGGTYYDITPIRKTTTGTATFTATDGSSTITVTDADHGANINDFVTFTNASAFHGSGNITAAVINQDYQIASVTASNTYTISAKNTSGVAVTANANDAGSGKGGGSTVATYQINVGLDDNSYGTGWGAGIWGGISGSAATTAVNDGSGMTASATSVTVDSSANFETAGYLLIDSEIIQHTGKTSTTFTGLTRGLFGTTAATHADDATVTEALGGWGMPATTNIAGALLRHWSHDNFGEDLIMNVRDGAIYYWDKSGGTSSRAVEITTIAGSTNAPTVAKKVIVSERDRHVLAFGCDSETVSGTQDPLLIRFASQESLTAWNALPTNTAGELRIGTGSEIITAVQTKQQTLVITDVSVHALQFIGPPFTFGITEVGRNTTIISENAAVAVEESVYWMGYREFYVYNGRTQKLVCPVQDFVFSDLNRDQDTKIIAGQNSAYSEVWWFYPSSSATANDKYVVYNYEQNIWYYGTLARTAWVDRGVFLYPIAASTDNYLYYQEFGLDDGSQSPASGITSFIESSQVTVGDGDKFFFASRVIPDITFRESTNETPQVNLTLKARRFPGTTYNQTETSAVTQSASTPIELFTEKADIRLRGRSFALRLESTATGVSWRLGTTRVDLRQDGGR
tara:strand:+ start:2055 stop:4181 length:2127 start_codon:yes stop_codon:yes gene_type:complete